MATSSCPQDGSSRPPSAKVPSPAWERTAQTGSWPPGALPGLAWPLHSCQALRLAGSLSQGHCQATGHRGLPESHPPQARTPRGRGQRLLAFVPTSPDAYLSTPASRLWCDSATGLCPRALGPGWGGDRSSVVPVQCRTFTSKSAAELSGLSGAGGSGCVTSPGWSLHDSVTFAKTPMLRDRVGAAWSPAGTPRPPCNN
jgi:hypothetical protein